MALTLKQQSNATGFPKPAELIEITGTSGLEAQDRVIMNELYRHAHDSGDLAKPDVQWAVSLGSIRISGVSRTTLPVSSAEVAACW